MEQVKQYVKDLSSYEYLAGWERCSLSHQLQDWAEKYRDQIAVIDSEREISYTQLNQEADRLAAAFMDLGILQGDKVVVQLPNRISFVVTFFALSRAGAVPILALPAHREAELNGIIKLAKPKAYIVAEQYQGYQYLDMAADLEQKFDFLQYLIVDGKQGGHFLLADLTGDRTDFPLVDCYSPAVLLLSGGTTGIPKLIPRTHSDYLYNARMSAQRTRSDQHSIYLAALPVAHNFPLSCPGLLGILHCGGTVVLCKNASPDEILAQLTQYHVTITALVPAMVNICMEMMEWDDSFDLSSLKILQVGGAILEDTLADKIINEWPCQLMQVFGTAEGLICFTNLDDDDHIVARCQGTPISPADEVKIVDLDGVEVESGNYGELLSRGPYTIDGYYQAKEANQESFTIDGFYCTGDRAIWTAEGNIRMGGRLKEQINRAGEKIMPAEIEAYLCQHTNIKEAAVVGVPDEVMGSRSCAFIMTTDGEEISLLAVHEFLKGLGVAQYKMPDQVETMEIWPLTSVGKINKKVLEELAQQQA